MPAGSLLTLLDDIASILDDVSVLTKKAAAKTAGVLGDDLALNAQQVSGVMADREIPVVWAVAKGSFVNKLILVPMALLISAVAPWAVMPLLMIGGIYLCYEGCEKLYHHFLHRHEVADSVAVEAPAAVEESEADKIRGAVRTDFVLSAEIIAITLGTVAGYGFGHRLLVLSVIAVVMTVGVYGLVAGIVKLDDLGLWLARCRSAFQQRIGNAILWIAPLLMKTLSVLGTAAMFLVGGGIVTHGISMLHHWIEHTEHSVSHAGGVMLIVAPVLTALIQGCCGLVAGSIAVLAHLAWKKLSGKSTAAH